MTAAASVPRCSKGWGGRCPRAKSPTCRCACGGQNHGNPAARKRADGADDSMDRYRTSREMLEPGWDYVPDRTLLPESGITAVRCERVVTGPGAFGVGDCEEGRIYVVRGNHVEPMQQRFVYHSPSGMEFGYGGSGPSDLAINILALVVKPKEAFRLRHDFKFSLMAKAFPRDGGILPLSAVRAWVRERYEQELAQEGVA